jgi:hypothetical protein
MKTANETVETHELMSLRREALQFRSEWKAVPNSWRRIHAAQQLFGDLNGWTVMWTGVDAIAGKARPFSPADIGRPYIGGRRSHFSYSDSDWTGHMTHFYEAVPNGRCIAVVGQPFNSELLGEPYETLTLEQYREDLDACAKQYGLRWHVPPMPYACINHCPGETLFIVMTLPDIEVKWLWEQIHETQFSKYDPLRRTRLRK